MAVCDVCKTKLGFMNKFKYAGGFICKDCYRKASRQFTETIAAKSLEEIQALCGEDYEISEDFHTTGRIGNYVLFDEKNKKLCVLNNRLTKEKTSKPDFYNIADITDCRITCHPSMSLQELEEKVLAKDESVVRSLKLEIDITGQGKPVEITFIKNSARIKSYAFRQSFTFAKRILTEINRLRGEVEE